MHTIIIYGTGSYVLGNKHVKPVIFPAVITFLKKNGVKAQIIFIKRSDRNIVLVKKKINQIIKNLNIQISFKIYPLSNIDNSKIFKKYENEKIICSIISTPDNDHFKFAKASLEKSINIIVVKPLVINMKENLELVKIAKKNKCIGFVDYHKRFDKHSRFIREFNIKNVKNLYLIDINYSQKKIIPEDIFKWSDKSNVLNYLGSHYIDFVYYTSGYKPQSVMAIGTKKYLLSKKINTFDSIICLIKWRKGNHSFLLNLKTNWIDPIKETSMSDQNVTLYYTNNKIISDQKNRGMYISSDLNDYESVNLDFNQRLISLDKNSYKYEGYGFSSIINFIEKIYYKSDGDKIHDAYPNLEQSYNITKVLEAAQKSLKNNSKWINIK